MESLAKKLRIDLRVLKVRLRSLAGAVFMPVPGHTMFDADGLAVRIFEQCHEGDRVLARTKAELKRESGFTEHRRDGSRYVVGRGKVVKVDVTDRVVPLQAIQLVSKGDIGRSMKSLAVSAGGERFRFFRVAFEARGGANDLSCFPALIGRSANCIG
ncbi:MAG: hypothetical protein Fues2KO_40580 [Fuerstiella sp.]